MTLDEKEVTQEVLQEAMKNCPPDKKVVEISSGVYKTLSRLRD